MDENHRDKFGALLGEVDWWRESREILKEWGNGNQATHRSQEATVTAQRL